MVMMTDEQYQEEIARCWTEIRTLTEHVRALTRAYEDRTGRSPYHKTGGYVGETWDSTSGQ